MTSAEAKARIKEEFMTIYYEWLNDRNELSEKDYGMKYGWQKSDKLMNLKDNLTAVTFFQKYIFTGRWLPAWEKMGYERKAIWELNREGFLSYQMYSNWTARHTGRTDFFFISQKTAKEIYKEAKVK